MSKKRRAKIQKHNEVVAEFLDRIEGRLKQLGENLAEAEDTEDQARKILKLQDLQRDFCNVSKELSNGLRQFANYRVHFIKTPYEKFLTGFVKVGGLGIFDYSDTQRYSRNAVDRTGELRVQNPRFGGFEETLGAQKARVSTMLEDTIRFCDLDEVSRSPWFPDAFHSASFLQKRFKAATAAKAALEDAPASASSPQKTTPVSEPDEDRISATLRHISRRI